MTYVRTRNRFDPSSTQPFRLSRSKLDLFLNCPRCFYLDRRLGIGQPPSYPFNLNNAVDTLLKKEFDQYRERGIPHPIMTKNRVEAVPFRHEKLDFWRDALRGGIDHHHSTSNFILCGGVDDLWLNAKSELVIVDYKATSKVDRVTIDAPWQMAYKRQLEIYAWLFRRNGFEVARTGYFVYCNGISTRPSFENCLHFEVSLLPYQMDDSWVETALTDARACLMSERIPTYSENCDYCGYLQAAHDCQAQLQLFEL